MRIKLRIDDSNQRRTVFTVFEEGANCGHLTMSTEGFCNFHQIVILGCQKGIDEIGSSGEVWVAKGGE